MNHDSSTTDTFNTLEEAKKKLVYFNGGKCIEEVIYPEVKKDEIKYSSYNDLESLYNTDVPIKYNKDVGPTGSSVTIDYGPTSTNKVSGNDLIEYLKLKENIENYIENSTTENAPETLDIDEIVSENHKGFEEMFDKSKFNVFEFTLVSKESLSRLKEFELDDKGNYCDWNYFSIMESYKDSGIWGLYLWDKVSGDLVFIKTLMNMEDLENVYEAILDKELQYKVDIFSGGQFMVDDKTNDIINIIKTDINLLSKALLCTKTKGGHDIRNLKIDDLTLIGEVSHKYNKIPAWDMCEWEICDFRIGYLISSINETYDIEIN